MYNAVNITLKGRCFNNPVKQDDTSYNKVAYKSPVNARLASTAGIGVRLCVFYRLLKCSVEVT